MRYLCLLRNQGEVADGAIIVIGKSRLTLLNMGMRTLVMVKIFHQHHAAEGHEHYPCKQTIYPPFDVHPFKIGCKGNIFYWIMQEKNDLF